MGGVTWRHEPIARLENEHLITNDNLELSRKNIVRFIFTRMRMTRNTHSRSGTHFQDAVRSARVCPRQTYGVIGYRVLKRFDLYSARRSGITIA